MTKDKISPISTERIDSLIKEQEDARTYGSSAIAMVITFTDGGINLKAIKCLNNDPQFGLTFMKQGFVLRNKKYSYNGIADFKPIYDCGIIQKKLKPITIDEIKRIIDERNANVGDNSRYELGIVLTLEDGSVIVKELDGSKYLCLSEDCFSIGHRDAYDCKVPGARYGYRNISKIEIVYGQLMFPNGMPKLEEVQAPSMVTIKISDEDGKDHRA